MNSNFDLNIKNYTIKELEDLFELPSNYDESIIEIQETKLRQNIITDRSIVALTKNNTLDFINRVKKTLMENLKKNLTPGTNVARLAKNWDNIYNMNKTLESSDVINAGSTNIIKRESTPYGQSSPSEFYQGSINPLNKRILRQNINIDTRFRDNYYTTTASNFHVDLPLRLTEVVSLQLSALEIPNTFYVISQVFGNNFFVLETPGVEPLVVTIPDGNYDYLGLQNYINNFLVSLSPPLPAPPNPYSSIQFIADANTPGGSGPQGGSGKMIVGLTSTATITSFSINFLTDRYGNDDRQTPLPLKLGWLMGFRNGYYENNTTYVSEGIINLLGPRYIYLVVDDFNNSVLDGFYGAFTSSILNKNILARISLQGSVFNYLSKDNFNLISTTRQYFGPVDIQKLQIQLLDEYGRILNLNNMDYSFCLTFQTVYDL
jgi:hypothetical protein